MVTDGYSHILDDDRRNNAQLFENALKASAEAGAGSAAEDTDEVAVKIQYHQIIHSGQLIPFKEKTARYFA